MGDDACRTPARRGRRGCGCRWLPRVCGCSWPPSPKELNRPRSYPYLFASLGFRPALLFSVKFSSSVDRHLKNARTNAASETAVLELTTDTAQGLVRELKRQPG